MTGRCAARGCTRSGTSRVSGWFHYFAQNGDSGHQFGIDFCSRPRGVYALAGRALVCPGHEQQLAEDGFVPCTADQRLLST